MKTRKQMSAMVMAFIIAFTAGYTPVAAAEHIHDETCGYKAEVPCGHTTHDENCGYTEATEGSACSHEHDENCYHQVTNCQHIHTDECYGDVSDASPSDAAEPENCSHICSEEDGCITEELDCSHIHDGDCGYAPAADEQPCKHAQGEHDETCGYVPASPCNVSVGSRLVRRILQKTNEVPKAETLLKTAECVVSSEIANTQESVTNWIKTTWLSGILVLDDALGIEYDVGIEDLQIATLGDAFTAAEDGTEENQEGTAGKFTFSVVVPRIDGVGEPRLTVEKTCTITPKRYTSSEISEAYVMGHARTINGTPVGGWQVLVTNVENDDVIAQGTTERDGSYNITIPQDGEYKLVMKGVTGVNPSFIEKRGNVVSGNTNFTLSTDNILGAHSKTVETHGGESAIIEFVSTGDSSSANTGLLVEGYTPTDNDWIFGAGQFSSGAVIADPNKVTVLPENITIYDNAFNWNGENYWIGDIVEINNEKYIVYSYGTAHIYWINLSTGQEFIYDGTVNLPGYASGYFTITEENKQVSINGAKYHARYAADNGAGTKRYYLYVPDDIEKMVAAGAYNILNDGTIYANFNSGYAPTDLLPEQSDEQKTIVTPNGDMFNITTAFSSNITITKNGTPQSGVKGAISISGLKNMGKSVSCHLSNGTYILGTNDADSDTHIWITEDQSPFMIFTFTEINTEIPVKTIPTDSGDGSGDSSSSSDGDSSYSDDSTYNPDILRGTWIRTDTGIWKFRLTSGAYAKSRWGLVDGLWYYFDGEGKMLTGWQFLNNRWYYLCTEETSKLAAGRKEGAMLTGWYYDPMYQGWFYLDTSGAMMTGWKEIGGRWYYFYENGVMAADTEVDGYKMGPDGAWIV